MKVRHVAKKMRVVNILSQIIDYFLSFIATINLIILEN